MCPIMDADRERRSDGDAVDEGFGQPPMPNPNDNCNEYPGYEMQMENCGWMQQNVCVKAGCEPSSVYTWDGRGSCCQDMCRWRIDGNGAICETKRAMYGSFFPTDI
jgi:hypothetical protein